MTVLCEVGGVSLIKFSNRSQQRWHENRIKRGEVVGGGFFVFRRGVTTGRIKVDPERLPFEHATLDVAQAEAVRLAAANPGVIFSVFQEVTRAMSTVKQEEVAA